MKTEIKSLTVEAMDENGTGLARIAILSAIDHDGDTYMPGAFAWKEGGHQWTQILPAHDRKAMPLGKARVYEEGDAAFAELNLNLNSETGREWHAALKFDLAKGAPIQEWSYGFGVVDAAYEQRGSERIRVLKRLDVHEVSPVVRGAGVGTGTLSMKSRGGFAAQIDGVISEIDDIVARAGSVKALRDAEGREMSKARIDQLAELKRRLDALLAEGGADQSAEAVRVAEQMAAEFISREARKRFPL